MRTLTLTLTQADGTSRKVETQVPEHVRITGTDAFFQHLRPALVALAIDENERNHRNAAGPVSAGPAQRSQ